MRKMRENVVVASGDQALFAADQLVFNDDGSTNVKPGQIVIWDPVTQKSLGPGTTTSDTDRVVISVGVDMYTVRSGFGEQLYGTSVQAAKASGPDFGAAEVVDLLFNVTETDDAFSVVIKVQDDQTENQFPFNRYEELTFTVKREDVACDSCESGIDATKLSCLIRDEINGKRPSNVKNRSTYVRKNFNEANEFTAHVLYGASDTNTATTFQYCINAVSTGDCDHCIEGDADIHSMNYTDENGVVQTNVEFTNVTNDAGNAVLLERVQAVVDQINDLIGEKGTKNGSAVLVRGVGPCASYKIEVNTCDSAFQLNSAVDTPLTICNGGGTGTNPFAGPFTEVVNCPNCGDQTNTLNFLGGVRIVADPVKIPTDDIWEAINNPKGILTRTLEIFPRDGFKCSKTFVRKVQTARTPENLGYEWAWKEYASANGGRGRTHDSWNYNVGNLNTPNDRSRANGNITNVKETYCSYTIEHSLPRRTTSVHGQQYSVKGRTVILIPSGSSTTIADFEAVLNPYLGSSGAPNIQAINCSADPQQDQIESVAGGADRYPDSNGYIV